MNETGFPLIKKEIGGIDINLRGVKIDYGGCDTSKTIASLSESYDAIYFVIKGKGNLQLSAKNIYILKSGTAFYVPKGVDAHCWTDDGDFYEYYTIVIDSLDGRKLLNQIGLSKSHPLLYFSDELVSILSEIYELAKKGTVVGAYKSVSLLYQMFSLLAKDCEVQKPESTINEYVEKALVYISAKYYDVININNIADALNINRSYFSTLFKNTMGVSPLQYLTEFRILQACKLLDMGKNVTEAALLTGFNTPSNFSFNFKRIMKLTPLEYKKQIKEKEKT